MNATVILIALTLAVISYGMWKVAILLLRWLFSEMAERNILMTLRTDGEIKSILKGKVLKRFVMRVKNHIIDPDNSDIYDATLENTGPVISHLWAVAQKRKDEPEFKEQKLQIVTKKIGESDEQFVSRIEADNGQTPVKPAVKEGNKITTSNDWYVLEQTFFQRLKKVNEPTWFENTFGVAWVGFPTFNVFLYRFRWIKYAQVEAKPGEPASKTVSMTARDETVSSLYYHYPVYGLEIDDAETGAGSLKDLNEGGERIQVRVHVVLETTTVNPHKTLFRAAGLSSAGEWLSSIMTDARDAIRIWIGKTDYDSLQGNPKVTANLDKIRKGLNGGWSKNRDGSYKQIVGAEGGYGQRIDKIRIVNVDIKSEKLQAAIDEVFVAKQEVRKAVHETKRDVIRAEGFKALASAPYLGKAEGYAKIAEVPNGAGTRMNVAESIGNVKVLSVGGEGTKNLLNIPESVIDDKSGKEPDKSA